MTIKKKKKLGSKLGSVAFTLQLRKRHEKTSVRAAEKCPDIPNEKDTGIHIYCMVGRYRCCVVERHFFCRTIVCTVISVWAGIAQSV
jgi:Ulp1 family protease